MDNAQNKESQEKQMERAAASPLKKPDLDDTVDADGKNRDASSDEAMIERNPDMFIGVNSSRVNAGYEQGDGLGGFDSRPARNGLALLLEKGFSVVDKGMVTPDLTEAERQYAFLDRDPHAYTLQGRRHFAMNRICPSRLIEIQRREK
jgi:hypothetical protein